jgi:hypothetical protein
VSSLLALLALVPIATNVTFAILYITKPVAISFTATTNSKENINPTFVTFKSNFSQ